VKALDLKSLELPPELVAKGSQASPIKPKKRRQHFVRVPWMWMEKLIGCRGQTLRVAFVVLYLDWKAKGQPVKLANKLPQMAGVGRRAKWRALADLERLGLISVERRARKSPIVQVQYEPETAPTM
jgi:hypothetical protein